MPNAYLYLSLSLSPSLAFLSFSLYFAFQDIPIVIAGNKADLASSHREVRQEEVTDWVFCELPRLRWVLQTSPPAPGLIKRLAQMQMLPQQLGQMRATTTERQQTKRRRSKKAQWNAAINCAALATSVTVLPQSHIWRMQLNATNEIKRQNAWLLAMRQCCQVGVRAVTKMFDIYAGVSAWKILLKYIYLYTIEKTSENWRCSALTTPLNAQHSRHSIECNLIGVSDQFELIFLSCCNESFSLSLAARLNSATPHSIVCWQQHGRGRKSRESRANALCIPSWDYNRVRPSRLYCICIAGISLACSGFTYWHFALLCLIVE